VPNPSYEVRLERVPGGLRLAQWSGGALERQAPVLPSAHLGRLILTAIEREVIEGQEAQELGGALAAQPVGDSAGGTTATSPGRAGDLREELRIERFAEGRLRLGRWLLRPGRGWELQSAPVMLPASRFAEALRQAAGAGML